MPHEPLSIACMALAADGWSAGMILALREVAPTLPQVQIIPRGPLPTDLDHTPWDHPWQGALTRRLDTARAVQARGLPVVLLMSDATRAEGLPCVAMDNAAFGRLAAQHLITLGHGTVIGVAWHDAQGSTWNDRLAAARAVVEGAGGRWSEARLTTDDEIARWARTLTPPVAVLAVNDFMARRIIRGCAWANLSVPEQVSVVGIDDDLFYSTTSLPLLTTVAIDFPATLRAAIGLIQAQRRGDPLPTRWPAIPPAGLVVRASTAPPSTADPLTRALDLIHRHAVHGLTVAELVAAVGIPRRTLHRAFLDRLGRTPFDAIRDAVIIRAQELLRTTLPLAAIAEACGFSSQQRFAAVFRQSTGMTPSAWRAQGRSASPQGPPPR